MIAPAVVHLAPRPAGRVLRVPALLRPGAAGRLGEVMAGVAVVGSGLAGFTAYQTLRRGGLEPEEIAVFGTEDDPAAVLAAAGGGDPAARRCAPRATVTASATSFPGLAVRSAVKRRSPGRSSPRLLDRYHPTVDEFLAHVEELRSASGWDRSLRQARIERVQAVGRRLRARRCRGRSRTCWSRRAIRA